MKDEVRKILDYRVKEMRGTRKKMIMLKSDDRNTVIPRLTSDPANEFFG